MRQPVTATSLARHTPGAVDPCGRRGGPCFMHLVTSDTPELCYAAVW
jgi:hypothetical protein